MKFSFVIPVFNIELYLRQCVESITAYAHRNVEVILVDDGSTDGSSALCDRLAAEFDVVFSYHINHSGLSAARNFGLQNVTGDYLWFVDGDDYLLLEGGTLDFIQNTIIMYGKPDVLCFNYCTCHTRMASIKERPPFDSEMCGLKNGDTALRYLTGNPVSISCWSKVLNTRFIREHHIRFVEGYVAEELSWNLDLFGYAESVFFLNEHYYVYRVSRKGSIMTENNPFYLESLLKCLERDADSLSQRCFSNETKVSVFNFLARDYCRCVGRLYLFTGDNREWASALLDKYRWLLSYRANFQVRLVGFFYDIFGFEAISRILQLYMKWHHNGW